MGETCCNMWGYYMGALHAIHDNDWPQSTALYVYCQLFECNPVYCATIGL